HGFLTGVETEHLVRVAERRGVHRESATVAKHIEHSPAAQVGGRRFAVLALIEIKAGLLSLGQIEPVTQTVFLDENRSLRRLAPVQAISQLEPFGLRDSFLGANKNPPR